MFEFNADVFYVKNHIKYDYMLSFNTYVWSID